MVMVLMLLLGPLIGLLVARRQGPLRPRQALSASIIGAMVGYGAIWLSVNLLVRYGLPHLPFDFAVAIVWTWPSRSQALIALATLVVIAALVAGVFLLLQWLIERRTNVST